jgi:hypothetical protein
VLADDLAQTVANLGATAVPVSIRVLGRKLLSWVRNRPDFFDRADADAVRLAQRAIDCPGLGHAHFGTTHEGGDIGRIGIAVADKAGGALGRENRCFENEPIRPRIAQRIDGVNMNAAASPTACQPQQPCMRHVPVAVDHLEVTVLHR